MSLINIGQRKQRTLEQMRKNYEMLGWKFDFEEMAKLSRRELSQKSSECFRYLGYGRYKNRLEGKPKTSTWN